MTTYGIARAATSPELTKYRTAGKWGNLRAAIFSPSSIYTARINQTFPTTDSVLEITYDSGSGTLANVLPDMTLLIGSSAGDYDIGIVRIRDKDATKFYIGETSDVDFADNLYLTVIDDFGLWARHVLISAGVPYMDGGVAYSDQHENFDPIVIMGGNRVVKMTGASIATSWDCSDSYLPDGSGIASRAWTAATASATSGMTTNTPTITFNTVGWHLVYCTITASNGKTFFGVRYIYVWNDANPPASCRIEDTRQEAESGGWETTITLMDNVSLSDVRERAMVILFAEEYFGDTAADIGPVTGCENIRFMGWIGNESINWNPQQGYVSFRAEAAHGWFAKVPSFPDGVEFITGTPAAWTEIQNLTVDLGVWHFLHWRTTATRIMDVFLSGDTRNSPEVSSMGGSLWGQIQEMAWNQIYARPGINAAGQFFLKIHPQMVPEASRTWNTVMTIESSDWLGDVNLERVTVPDVSLVDFQGVAIDTAGAGTPYFALAPGHAYPHHGSPDPQDNLLVANLSQSLTLAGLYRSWRNNQFPDIPIRLKADIALIDCFPNSFCAISIQAGDTPRGITYSGNLVPVSISLIQDPDTGYIYREVNFEAETFESLAVEGDYPGSGDVSTPPVPSLPTLPDFPIIIPGTVVPSSTGPTKVIVHDNHGVIYTLDFDATNPHWLTMNSGLTSAQYAGINKIVVNRKTGEIYAASRGTPGSSQCFIARAAGLGQAFTIIEDQTSIISKLGGTTCGILGIGCNQTTGQMGYVIASDVVTKFYIGTGTSFSAGATITARFDSIGSVSYGFGKWRVTGFIPAGIAARLWIISANGASLVSTITPPASDMYFHKGAGSTDVMVHTLALNIITSTGNGSAFSGSLGGGLVNYSTFADNDIECDPTGMLIMLRYDTGKRGKSSDGGNTFATMGNLPFTTGYVFAYAGPGDGNIPSTSRWVAAYSVIRYSPDFGTTWYNKEGDITSISPTPAFNIVEVVEY